MAFNSTHTGAEIDAGISKAQGVENGATANATDAQLRDRATHTGAQVAATITDFSTAADARIAAASISALTDVDISAATDGQLLSWNETSGQVEPVDPAAGGGDVTSVNGATGVVVLDADDINDAATTNKFVSQAQIDKLTAIEAAADVTDTANVTAAGAVMDSEFTNLAAVKAFDPANYATAGQGALADTALQPTLTSNLDANGFSIGGFLVEPVPGVSGLLTDPEHTGRLLKSTGNIEVPVVAGFNCQIEFGGAHTITFNATATAAFAAGDVASVLVTDATTPTIKVGLLAVADQVGFS